MRNILCIESATRNCSVSVGIDGRCASIVEVAEEGYSHAEKLHKFIKTALEKSNLGFKDLHAIAVSKGPGSYTGLRIGVSAAKGLCFALEIPLLSVDTLAVLASQIDVSEGVILPMIDARRMEVYSAMFSPDGHKIKDVAAEIITPDSYADLTGPIHIAGDCQQKLKEVLTDAKFHFYDRATHPSAKDMTAMADASFLAGNFENLAYFEPFYLKDFMVGVK